MTTPTDDLDLGKLRARAEREKPHMRDSVIAFSCEEVLRLLDMVERLRETLRGFGKMYPDELHHWVRARHPELFTEDDDVDSD